MFRWRKICVRTNLFSSGVLPPSVQLAKEYDFKEHFFKDSDFTDEELRRCADAVLSQDGSPGDEDFDVEDPAVRSAFGLE